MADWAFTVTSFTIEARASGSNYVDNKYMGLMGGSATQMIAIKEVNVSGLEASTSSPVILLLGRDSTVQATPTALSAGTETNAARHPSTAALAAPQVAFTASSTKPQRSTTLIMSHLSFNALGGLIRKRFPEGYEPTLLGNTAATLGEISLSGFTGSTLAAVSGEIVYEPR